MKVLLKKGKNKSEHRSAPIGIKMSEWVNCLWYLRKSKGSTDDLMKTSRSGAIPESQPIIKIEKCFAGFFVRDWGRLAPKAP